MFLFANEFKFSLLVHAFKELAAILALTTTYYSVSRYPLNALKITFHKKKEKSRGYVYSNNRFPYHYLVSTSLKLPYPP